MEFDPASIAEVAPSLRVLAAINCNLQVQSSPVSLSPMWVNSRVVDTPAVTPRLLWGQVTHFCDSITNNV